MALIGLASGCMARRAVDSGWPHASPLIDRAWRFFKGDAPGAEQAGFEDASWRQVDVPHDWSIEGPYDQKNPSGGAGAFLPGGVGWYRKHFSIAELAGKRVFVTFDGVMANSDVWINGVHLGHRPYGYVTFEYELTGHVNAGENVLAVRADTSRQPASRWYAGSGIYRHVHLRVTEPVHFVQNGVFVTTPHLEPGAKRATVHVRSEVVNQSEAPQKVAVHVGLVDPEGKPAGKGDSDAQTVAPGATGVFEQDVDVAP